MFPRRLIDGAPGVAARLALPARLGLDGRDARPSIG